MPAHVLVELDYVQNAAYEPHSSPPWDRVRGLAVRPKTLLSYAGECNYSIRLTAVWGLLCGDCFVGTVLWGLFCENCFVGTSV